MQSENVGKTKLANQIAGEISLSETPGETIKKWREIFKASQRELADAMEVMPSVISDYENGRRKSPGIKMINKMVTGLLEVDEKNGGKTIREFSNISEDKAISSDTIISIEEFDSPQEIEDFVEYIGGDVLEGENKRKIYGYSVIDSMKAIVNLSTDGLRRIYGSTTERALIFTNITRGRSPMVAIKVTNLKPSLVVLHGIPQEELDPLALRIGKAENIPVAHCQCSREELIEKLNSV